MPFFQFPRSRFGFDTHWLKSDKSRKIVTDERREVTLVAVKAALRRRSEEDDI